FYIKRVTECENCRSSHTSDEPQNILECPVPENNGELSDCLNIYFKEEYLTGNTAYDCHSCQSKQNAKTKMGINSLSKVLLISLKRFKANDLEKSQFAVKYPEKLCIKQWLSEDYSFDITEEKEIYQLFAIVVHDSNKMTTEKLLNDLEKQVQFRFCENVYPEQRRFSKADAFGKLGSNERLWIKGELSTIDQTSYPKLKLGIPPKYHNNSWSLEVHTVTENNGTNGIHYLQLEKKILRDQSGQKDPLINSTEIKIKQADLENGSFT
ncbi:unnamed protein product, partial [Rotaria sp. Silwood1]